MFCYCISILHYYCFDIGNCANQKWTDKNRKELTTINLKCMEISWIHDRNPNRISLQTNWIEWITLALTFSRKTNESYYFFMMNWQKKSTVVDLSSSFSLFFSLFNSNNLNAMDVCAMTFICLQWYAGLKKYFQNKVYFFSTQNKAYSPKTMFARNKS